MLDSGLAIFLGTIAACKLLATRRSATSLSPSLSPYDLLTSQDSHTSSFIINSLESSAAFVRLASCEGKLIRDRDAEDDVKLDEGIAIARSKNAVPRDYKAEPYITIDVLGKSADEVAATMLSHIDTSNAFVLVLCGLSGTGKGTTVEVLKKRLAEQGHKVTTWSNGNIFRSMTYLAATYCLQNGKTDFDPDFSLTPELLQSFLGMLSFGKQKNGKYDTRINGLGVDMLVGDVCNTELKKPLVSKNIPTVAKVTQGEVISFAASAIEALNTAGEVVLLEGRSQTVDYVRTPSRFTLTLSDGSLIGKRRAAQRIGAEALKVCNDKSPEGVKAALQEVAERMAGEEEV